MDQNTKKDPQRNFVQPILEVILESVWVLKFDSFLFFLERVLFATLGAIREAMGATVVPKGPKRDPKETILWVEWISENSGFTIIKQPFLRFWRCLETT